MSRKWLLLGIAILILIVVVITLVAVDFNGWGTALSGAGGPFAASLYGAFNSIPIWISSGGWPTLAFGIVVFGLVWPLVVAVIFWQKDVPYVLNLQQNPNATATGGSYQNQPSQNIIPLQENK